MCIEFILTSLSGSKWTFKIFYICKQSFLLDNFLVYVIRSGKKNWWWSCSDWFGWSWSWNWYCFRMCAVVLLMSLQSWFCRDCERLSRKSSVGSRRETYCGKANTEPAIVHRLVYRISGEINRLLARMTNLITNLWVQTDLPLNAPKATREGSITSRVVIRTPAKFT